MKENNPAIKKVVGNKINQISLEVIFSEQFGQDYLEKNDTADLLHPENIIRFDCRTAMASDGRPISFNWQISFCFASFKHD